MDDSKAFGAYLARFSEQSVLVLGDAILDEDPLGRCDRLSPEAPVPVLQVTRSRQVLGGAGNTAANVVSLGGRATLVAFVGEDEPGTTLRRCAEEAGIDLRAITGGPTLRKTRVVGQSQQIVRLDYEDARAPTAAAIDSILTQLRASVRECDIVVISDYAKGFLSPALASEIIACAHSERRQVVVDPRPQHGAWYRNCDYLTPNWRESLGLLGWPDAAVSAERVDEVAKALASRLNTNVVLTLGADGMSFCSRDATERFTLPTLAKEVFDVSGAGDTVVAALALALSAGAGHLAALSLANHAASIVVGKFGTATVAADEMLQKGDGVRLVSRAALRQLADTERAKGRRIVTINGSFDLLHSGHLHILRESRRRGDVLLVGLNSDASVRLYKGKNRPVVPQSQRAEMLLALRMVDYVHIFNEPDPTVFLDIVRPDVHVNGSEYGSNCIESETVRRNGGALHTVDRLPDLSTTALWDSLVLACDGQPLGGVQKRADSQSRSHQRLRAVASSAQHEQSTHHTNIRDRAGWGSGAPPSERMWIRIGCVARLRYGVKGEVATIL